MSGPLSSCLLSLHCRYWIYAAVAAGEKGLLVSNDEMRDHIFQACCALRCD